MNHLRIILCSLCILCGATQAAQMPNFIVILAEEPSDRKGPELESGLTAEERKLSRKERQEIIKKRSKPTGLKPEPTAVLYNLSDDIGEQTNLIAKHPETVARLEKQMEAFQKELRDHARPAGVANQP